MLVEDYQDQVKNWEVRISCLRFTISSQNKFSKSINKIYFQLPHKNYILQLHRKGRKCVFNQWVMGPTGHAPFHSLKAPPRSPPLPLGSGMPVLPLFIHHSQPESTGLCGTSRLASDYLTVFPIPSMLQAVRAPGWLFLLSLPGTQSPNSSAYPPSGSSSHPSEHLLVLILVNTWPQSDQWASGPLTEPNSASPTMGSVPCRILTAWGSFYFG